MKVIRFRVGQAPYQAGEIAGFPDEIAERYLSGGVAELYEAREVAADLTVAAEEAPPKDKMIRRSKQK